MFYKQPKSKQTILDLARDLPRQIEKLENQLKETIDSINGILDPIVNLNNLVDNTINHTNKKVNSLDVVATIDVLENILIKLIELASEKEDLKESARLRKAKVKTGNVKAEIDSHLPDEKLLEMIMDFSIAYKKFCDYAKNRISVSIQNPTTIYPASDERLDRFIHVKEFIRKEPEIRGKHLNDMFSNVSKERDELKKYLSIQVKLYNHLEKLDEQINEREAKRTHHL